MNKGILIAITAALLCSTSAHGAAAAADASVTISREHQLLLDELHAGIATRNSGTIQKVRTKIELLFPCFSDKYSPRKQRDEKLHLLLAGLAELHAAQDRSYDPTDGPDLSVPGARFSGSPGEDAASRAEFQRRVDENARKIERSNREFGMRQERDGWVQLVAAFAKRYELTPADQKTLQQAIDARLTDPQLNSEVKAKIIAPKK